MLRLRECLCEKYSITAVLLCILSMNGWSAQLIDNQLNPKAKAKTKTKTKTSTTDQQLLTQGQWRDPSSNLIWMRCSLGQHWVGKSCRGNGKEMNWDDAVKVSTYVDSTTHWRLPTVNELKTLMIKDKKGYSSVFIVKPNKKHLGWYWSSSPVVFNSGYSRFVSFNYGYDAYGDKRYNGYVRLVRSSKDGL